MKRLGTRGASEYDKHFSRWICFIYYHKKRNFEIMYSY